MKFQKMFEGNFEKIGSAEIEPPKVISIIGTPGSWKSALTHFIMKEYLESKEGKKKIGVYATFEEPSSSHEVNIQKEGTHSFGLKEPTNFIYADVADLAKEGRARYREYERARSFLFEEVNLIAAKDPRKARAQYIKQLTKRGIDEEIAEEVVDEAVKAREVYDDLLKKDHNIDPEQIKSKLLSTFINPGEYPNRRISPSVISHFVPGKKHELQEMIKRDEEESKSGYLEGILEFIDDAEKKGKDKVGMVAIDSAVAIQPLMGISVEKFRSELTYFLNELRDRDIFVILLTEGPQDPRKKTELSEAVEFLSDITMKLIFIPEEQARYLSVVKWRGGGRHNTGQYMLDYLQNEKKFEIGEPKKK